jgi:AraC-like DNA-binding protein
MTARGPRRGPVQIRSYQLADFRSGSGTQVGSAYIQNGISAALIEETPNEIVAPAVEQTVLIVSLNARPDQRADLLGPKILRPFPKHSVMVVPAGLSTWWVGPRVAMTQIHIHIEPSFLARIDPHLLKDLDRPRFGFEDPILAQMANAVQAALTAYEGTGTELYMEHLLLAYTMRVFAGEKPGSATASLGLAPRVKQDCMAYLQEHLGDQVHLTELAALAGFSPHHFAKMFKQATGYAPHAFQIMLRMNKARELLAQTDLPVSEVAALVGYSSPSTFARIFHAQVQASPLQYRQQMRPSKRERDNAT